MAVEPLDPRPPDRPPEGALQAFNDEVLDLDHATFARECAIDIPGPETDALASWPATYDSRS